MTTAKDIVLVVMTNVAKVVPGVRALQTYKKTWLRKDVVAGVVLAAILVPQGMADAELADKLGRGRHRDGVPRRLRAHGLSSRVLVLGRVGSWSTNNPGRYLLMSV